jgi:exodeoxyribonuclease VII large subunit
MQDIVLSVSELNALVNQTLQMAYPQVLVEGEVASFKVNQSKWVFFDIKDSESTIACFMPIYQLKTVIEDGMRIKVLASPNLTRWGKFSLTVKTIEHIGEGDVKKAFELMRAKFELEGLFAPERKRVLPRFPQRIALVTSAQAAAYADFLAILDERFGGIDIDHMQVQVQGIDAPVQITEAIEYFNSANTNYDVLVIIRGGGSNEDLQAFNSEDVVRAIFGSKIPTLVGVGHETDITLSELVSDVRAATPSDAARRIVIDKHTLKSNISEMINAGGLRLNGQFGNFRAKLADYLSQYQAYIAKSQANLSELTLHSQNNIIKLVNNSKNKVTYQTKLIQSLNPRAILDRGYALVTKSGKAVYDPTMIKPDDILMIQLAKGSFNAKKVNRRDNA